MIELTKILEGGIDLRTGQEEPICLVISMEGYTEMLPISKKQMEVILTLLARSQNGNPKQETPPNSPKWVERQQSESSDIDYSDQETGVSAF